MSDYVYETDLYGVKITDNAIGEDNAYGQPGYAVVNLDTEIVEFTSMQLPHCRFYADMATHQMTESEEEETMSRALPAEDVLLN